MPMKLYLGIGHGIEPNGVLDGGAHNDTDGTDEHDLNTRVCQVADAALTRCGVEHFTEQNSGASHDPDYRGSVIAVNAGRFDVALEVHFDSADAPRGGFGIYLHEDGQRLAQMIRNHWGEMGLPQRANYKDVRGLWFLQGSNCPAVIWECDRTAAHDDGEVTRMGEAIAAGVCDYVGVPYRRDNPTPSPRPLPPPVDYPEAHMRHFDIHVEGKNPQDRAVGLDSEGHGSTLVDTPAGTVITAYPNTAGYVEVPVFVGAQDDGGKARIIWKGPPNYPPFDAHVWTTA